MPYLVRVVGLGSLSLGGEGGTVEATRRGGLRGISCQAEKQSGRKDVHRKPLLPTLTGRCCYALYFYAAILIFIFLYISEYSAIISL
jgi:hypothetical protein